ncbi:MAG TPA: indole-3-glycerol-phosphate synthase [Gemmatimonadaceae bacterium]
MQASSVWNPPDGTLGAIVRQAQQRASCLHARAAELDRAADAADSAPGFGAALRCSTVGVIAEIKRRSPSKGWIQPSIDAAEQALAYQSGGAAAISVLTEPVHFGGSAEDLADVRARVGVPVLKKDFHVDPIQLVEAKALGASAALLIVRALSPASLRRMTDAGHSLGLELLIEVRDDDELARALDVGADVIGINNRNLETLVIEPGTAERMLGMIPASVVAVAESGVTSRSDVERFAHHGADAVLVGSVVSAADDPAAAVRALTGVARVAREH